MSIFKQILLGVLLSVSSTFLYSGCNDDPCGDEACTNGQCIDETCVCDSLFEGVSCTQLERNKYIGTWRNGSICSSGSEVYSMEILAGTGQGDISFSTIGPNKLSVFAIVDGAKLTIPDQAYGLNVISGQGGIDVVNQAITLDLEVDYGSGNFVNCVSALEK